VPRQFDIVIKQTLSSGDTIGALGYVWSKGTVIYLNGGALSDQPTKLEGTLVHEMAHVAQRYSMWNPHYWSEGMADYVRWKLCPNGGEGDAKETNCPVCSNLTWHYTQGYQCGAAFLFYLQETYGSNVVRGLNARLRHLFYSDTYFKIATGKTVDQLWEDFKRTARYTQSAAEITTGLAKSGYKDGVHPKFGADLSEQIRHQPGGQLTLQAFSFLMNLMDKHKLPGLSHGEKYETLIFPFAEIGKTESSVFPVSRTFHGFAGATNIFNYTVLRDSRWKSWKLRHAWRTDQDGHVVEEYTIR
jgi:hypothetical protein